MQLETKHIQHYPIGGKNALRVQRVDKTIHAIQGFVDDLFIVDNNGEDKYIAINGNYNKPLLRPMSDLYKPCLEGGKTPIVEIAKAIGLKFRIYDIGDKSVDLYLTERKGQKSRFWYDDFKTGTFCLTIYGYGKVNQLVGFNYLFSHHFDVFGLIDKGLAIDINRLNQEEETE